MRAGPTIAEGRVFVVTIDNKTYALDLQDGKVLWSHTGTTEVTGIIGRASPAVAGGSVGNTKVRNRDHTSAPSLAAD